MTWWQLAILFFIGVVVLGVLYEIVFAAIDRRRYSNPKGKLVDVGGHRLHIHVMGDQFAQQPTIIMDSAVGSNSLDWQLVHPQIAEFAQVAAYDRTGYGWSENSASPRTIDAIVSELHTLLTNSGLSAPYVLVGHSFGGIYMMKFAERYPDLVAGIVLVDSSHPDSIAEQDTDEEINRLKGVQRFKRFGILRLLFPRITHRADMLPDKATKREYIAFMLLDSDMVLREAQEMFKGVTLPETLDVPLTVLSRKVDDDSPSNEQKWLDYQTRLLDLSPQSEHIRGDRYSHYIAMVEPEAVIDAVRAMHERVSSIESADGKVIG